MPTFIWWVCITKIFNFLLTYAAFVVNDPELHTRLNWAWNKFRIKASYLIVSDHFNSPVWKTGRIMGTPAAGRWAGWRRPQGFRSQSQRVSIRSLSNVVNMLVGIIFRLSSITSQINHTLLIMNCPKLGFTLFVLSWSNLVNILVGIISRPSSITSQISHAFLNNGP